MKSNIKTINIYSALSVALFFITYSTSLNNENRWIVLNTPWLSNNFAFAIAGGDFSKFACCSCLRNTEVPIHKEANRGQYFWAVVFSLYTSHHYTLQY